MFLESQDNFYQNFFWFGRRSTRLFYNCFVTYCFWQISFSNIDFNPTKMSSTWKMNKKLLHFPANNACIFYVILSAFALSIGGIIYIFLRPSEYVFFGWIRAVGLDNLFNAARSISFSHSLPLPEWFVFSLPNGLWAFAYALLITCQYPYPGTGLWSFAIYRDHTWNILYTRPGVWCGWAYSWKYCWK